LSLPRRRYKATLSADADNDLLAMRRTGAKTALYRLLLDGDDPSMVPGLDDLGIEDVSLAEFAYTYLPISIDVESLPDWRVLLVGLAIVTYRPLSVDERYMLLERQQDADILVSSIEDCC
jgi:hypothetical protein